MTPLRSAALTLGLLTVLGISNANAHEGPLNLPSATRNLERAAHRLVDSLTLEHDPCEFVVDASQALEDSSRHLRASTYRRLSRAHLSADFRAVVSDFRLLVGHLRKHGMPDCIVRDVRAVRMHLESVGRLLEGRCPSFAHDCDVLFRDYDHEHGHQGHDEGDHHDEHAGHRDHQFEIAPRPFLDAPRGGTIGLKLGKVQLQFRSR